MVPNGWENKTLESLCEPTAPITYGVLKPGNYANGGTPLLQIKDLLNDLSEIDSLHRISPELDLEYKRSRIATNDILISLVGTVGRIGLVPKELNGANIHRNLGRIRTKNYEFLVHYLNSDIAKNKIGLSSSGSSQSALNLSVLKALKVSIPPLPEQRKIAQILSTWDRGIATTEKLIDASKQQKKALMQQLLTGKKRLIDPETGKAFEGDWEKACIGKISQVVTGNTPSTQKKEFYDGRNLFVSPSDLGHQKYISKTTKRLTELGFEKTRKIRAGSTLFTCIGSTIGKLGMASKELATNQQINAVIPNNGFDDNFVYYELLLRAKQIQGLASTQAVPIINKTTFESELISIPPTIEEQQKIASVLTAADKEIELLETKLAHLKLEKKALMQQLLTGKKRVNLAQTMEVAV